MVDGWHYEYVQAAALWTSLSEEDKGDVSAFWEGRKKRDNLSWLADRFISEHPQHLVLGNVGYGKMPLLLRIRMWFYRTFKK